MAYSRWIALVENELVRLGVHAVEVKPEVDDNEAWFREQYDAGAAAEITAGEWFTLHYDNADD